MRTSQEVSPGDTVLFPDRADVLMRSRPLAVFGPRTLKMVFVFTPQFDAVVDSTPVVRELPAPLPPTTGKPFEMFGRFTSSLTACRAIHGSCFGPGVLYFNENQLQYVRN
jgi:hypothetical protein